MSETLMMVNPYEDTAALEAWLAERRNGLGGSDAAAAIGKNPYKSPLELYCEKIGIGEPQPDNDGMEWGRLLEPLVADKYRRETGRELCDPGRFTIARHPERSYLFATLDRDVFDPEKPGIGVLEIKTTSERHAEEWEEGVPELPWIQIQHQLGVTGRQWASAAVLIGGRTFRWCDVERDDAFIDQLFEDLAGFWERVQGLDPPQPTSGWSSRKALERLYPTDDGSAIALPGDCIEPDLELLQVNEDIKQLQARKEEIESRFKALIGSASVGVLPNGVKYSWKTQNRAAYQVAATSFRVLRRSAK